MESRNVAVERTQANDAGGTDPVYRTEDPKIKKDYDECASTAEAVAAPKLTTADLEASYLGASAFIQCLRSAGFDMGLMVSMAEYVNTAGKANLASRWNEVSQLDGFADQMTQCDLATRPK
jgi:hypothetical protein